MRSPRTSIWRPYGGVRNITKHLKLRHRFNGDPGLFVRLTQDYTVRLLTLVTGRLWDFTDVVYLQRVHRDFFGAIVDQVKFTAFVQGTTKLSLPLCRIGFIDSLLELSRLHGPRLGEHFHVKDVWYHLSVSAQGQRIFLSTKIIKAFLRQTDTQNNGECWDRDRWVHYIFWMMAQDCFTFLSFIQNVIKYLHTSLQNCTVWTNNTSKKQHFCTFLSRTHKAYM